MLRLLEVLEDCETEETFEDAEVAADYDLSCYLWGED